MDYRKLFDYDYWANSQALASLKTVPSGKEQPRKTFNHVIGAQRIWLARFENPAPPSAQPWPDLTLEECASAIEDLRRRWADLLDNLTPEKLAGDLTYLSLKGIEYRTPIQDVLMHLVLHSAYHRGQVAAAVREAGGKAAPTDYVASNVVRRGRLTSGRGNTSR
jgi:uncharacterized damage-inducible protein DinB